MNVGILKIIIFNFCMKVLLLYNFGLLAIVLLIICILYKLRLTFTCRFVLNLG